MLYEEGKKRVRLIGKLWKSGNKNIDTNQYFFIQQDHCVSCDCYISDKGKFFKRKVKIPSGSGWVDKKILTLRTRQ